MRHIAAIIFFSACVFCAGHPALADEPADVFFIAMRAPDVDPVPRYISVYADASDAVSAAISGCDGQTYYATLDDASVVTAALANGNIVELTSGDPGTSSQNSSVVCVVQSGS
jgi:hypothetical protein